MEPNLLNREDRSLLRQRLQAVHGGKAGKRDGHSAIEVGALCTCFQCQTFYLLRALDALDYAETSAQWVDYTEGSLSGGT